MDTAPLAHCGRTEAWTGAVWGSYSSLLLPGELRWGCGYRQGAPAPSAPSHCPTDCEGVSGADIRQDMARETFMQLRLGGIFHPYKLLLSDPEPTVFC